MVAAAAALFAAFLLLAFLTPEANTDLFLHLASAREAARLGLPYLEHEAFSFTLQGAPWVNHEWLFQALAWALYKQGGIRALAVLRALMLAAAVLAVGWMASRRAPRHPWLGWPAAFLMAGLVIPRSTFQPELFTLLFLLGAVALKDRLLSDFRARGWAPSPWVAAWGLLFAVWANLHGGFPIAFAVLAACIGARWLEAAADARRRGKGLMTPQQWASRRRVLIRESAFLTVLGLTGAAAALANPAGWRLFEFIAEVMRDAPAAGRFLEEWQPLSLSHPAAWPFVASAALAAMSLVAALQRGERPWEQALLLAGMGYLALAHVRYTALFGAAVLPAAASLAGPLKLPRWGKAALLAAAALALATPARRAWAMAGSLAEGLPRDHVDAERLPVAAVDFLEREPALAAQNALTEWGWGGYAAFRLGERGFKVLFHGWGIFLPLLSEASAAAGDPATWARFVDEKGVTLVVMRPPDRFFPSREGPPRSWHGAAFPRERWALVWWDAGSFVLVRRDRAPKELLARLEYALRLPLDPHLALAAWKSGTLDRAALLRELQRNRAEAGPHPLHAAFK